jgi:hypothetical protein
VGPHQLGTASRPWRTVPQRSVTPGGANNPGPDESLRAGDTFIVLGRPEQIDDLARLARG